MNLLEAVQALIAGKKIRRSNWMDPNLHIFLNEEDLLCISEKGKVSYIHTLDWTDRYELYNPPKRKVKDCIGEIVTVMDSCGGKVRIKPLYFICDGTVLVNMVGKETPILRTVYSLSGDTEVVE